MTTFTLMVVIGFGIMAAISTIANKPMEALLLLTVCNFAMLASLFSALEATP